MLSMCDNADDAFSQHLSGKGLLRSVVSISSILLALLLSFRSEYGEYGSAVYRC
jgi:hypothetical protein